MTSIYRDPHDIVLAPVISEKSYNLLDEGSTPSSWTARPTRRRSRSPSRRSSTSGLSVNTMNREGKSQRTRFGVGKRVDTKRAIVALSEGTIDIFGTAV